MKQQRMIALDQANDIRSLRAGFKERLKHLPVARAVEEAVSEARSPGPAVRTMKAEAFLRAVPRVGSVRARTLLREAKVIGDPKLGRLTADQREAIATQLEGMQRRRSQRLGGKANDR